MTNTSFGGSWTEQKLEILGDYLDTYTTVLKRQRFRLIYVDAFAGGGLWSPRSGYSDDDYGEARELHKGSPLIALDVKNRPFDKLIFVEKDSSRSESLKHIRDEFAHRDIEIINEDANTVLPTFCQDLGVFDRAVVFLDPYATQVSWETVEVIARTKRIDCWILFPRMAIARMMPTDTEPSPELQKQLNRIFGGREHWQTLYRSSIQMSFLEDEPRRERAQGSEDIALCYLKRLESVFTRTASVRRTFRNSKDSPIFELFFGAGNPTGAPKAVKIAEHILRNW